MFFEQHVAAYWLAQLLVRSIPPILTDTGVTEVHFQTEHLGFNTDDFLVVCTRADATTARLVGQVKRSFMISALEGASVTAEDLWPFLSVLHVLSLDLHTSTRQTEGHIKTLLALKSNNPDPVSTC